jgi:hypothetical protein
VLVAYACDPTYSGGRNQEDHGSKPAQQDPISKIPKRSGGVAQGGSPEFKPQYCQKKIKTQKILKYILIALKILVVHYMVT